MTMSADRWKEISPSAFPWEREALDFLRAGLPDHEPYRAWVLFEFVADDGSVNEVDALILTPKGFFLVEIKSRPGVVTGDAGTWTWTDDGRKREEDNPLLLANRKAKRLKSLLERQSEWKRTDGRLPFLAPLVFLSAPGVTVRLAENARTGVGIRDEGAPQSTMPPGPDRPEGILHALKTVAPEQRPGWERRRIDRVVAKGIARALDQLGIRPSRRMRRVGDHEIGRLLLEGPGYQDFEATHVALKDRGARWRVRIYTVDRNGPRDWAATVGRAARREYEILHGIQHPGILRPLNYTESEHGPALIFEAPPNAVRLDHFLVRHGPQLGVDARLAILRSLADALRYAHERRLYHRALSPASVLVTEPNVQRPRVQVFNWQTALRELATASGSSVPSPTGTSHLEQLIEPIASVYMAPEALSAPDVAGEAVDVFSLGAVAYTVFAGRPPADNVVDLQTKLREGRGLRLPDAVDGACRSLKELVQFATNPDVGARLDGVQEFIDRLNEVEEELTAPAEGFVKNPLDAAVGDTLQTGDRVTKVLGTGSTAVVLVVEKDGHERILKISRGPEQDGRIRDEATVLDKLRHPHIVQCQGLIQVGDRPALVLGLAGEKTLRRRLREDGQLSVDLLERFGDDLLDAVRYLERFGVPHRDIKPDNLGVARMGRETELHVILFDFSLSKAPATEIRAGTSGYLEPFLGERKPPRWDVHAERYAVAVTLYEMAAGVLPKWGDGQSDPGSLTCEVTVEADRFDAEVREPLTTFFRKALSRDFEKRFHNAEEMLAAWRQVFRAGERKPTEDTQVHPDLDPHLDAATAETLLVAIPFSTRAQNALNRANAVTVQDLLNIPPFQLSNLRGVGSKTRRELLHAMAKLRTRLGAGAPAPPKEAEPEAVTVDELARGLLTSRTRNRDTTEARALRLFLGLDQKAQLWPAQTQVAEAIGVTRARVGQVITQSRLSHWSKWPALTRLREDMNALLDRLGGVATVEDLAQALVAARGCSEEPPRDLVLAAGVVRAATEVEGGLKEPRWGERRIRGRVFLLAEEPDAQALGDYVERLGATADRLAEVDPLPSPVAVEKALREIGTPAGFPPLPQDRLVRVAATASRKSAASSRLELYPRGMPAARALNLARGAVLGAKDLSDEELRDRVRSRYPEAQPLPERPALDELLREANLDLSWDPTLRDGKGGYRFKTVDTTGVSSASTRVRTYPTILDRPIEPTPEVVEARLFEERLARAARDGGYLVLRVGPNAYRAARRQILRRFPAVREVNGEELLLRHMRDAAKSAGAAWDVVLRADATADGTPDRRNLTILVGRALPAIEADLLGTPGTVLLTNPGLLARYDRLDLLRKIADRVGARGTGGAALTGLWVLIPQTGQVEMPMLDGKAIPVVTKAEWAAVPRPWIENIHRSAPKMPEETEARA